MGRGSSKAGGTVGGGNSLLNQVTDNTDFKAWIKENLDNPEFKQFGRENGMDDVKNLWYEKRAAEELKNLHELSKEDAIAQVRDAIPDQTSKGWFLEANSDVKPKLVDYIMMNEGTLNAGLNIAYSNYKDEVALNNIRNHTSTKPLSFKTWLNTPQTVYRGEHGQEHVKSDIFLSFTRDKTVAKKFGESISTIKIKPIDTWGSYQTTGEQEFLVPVRKLRK